MTIVRPTATAIVDNVRPAGSDVFIEARDVVKTYDTGRLQVETSRLTAAKWSPSWGRPAAARPRFSIVCLDST